MANCNEHAMHVQVRCFAGVHIANPRTGDTQGVHVTQNLIQNTVPMHFDFFIAEQPVLEDLSLSQRN